MAIRVSVLFRWLQGATNFTESTAVIAGGVGGGIILCQILVCLPIFCIPARREEPVYDVINQPLNQTAAKLPLSPNVATASTAM